MKHSYSFVAGLLPLLLAPAAHAQLPGTTVTGAATASIRDPQQINLVADAQTTFSAGIGFDAIVQQPEAVGGQWSTPRLWTPYARAGQGTPVTGMIGIHTHVLPSGRVLSWEGHNDDLNQGHLSHAYQWSPDPNESISTQRYPNLYAHFDLTSSNIFCSGHTFLSDRKLLVVGGHYSAGLVDRTLDPNTVPALLSNNQPNPNYIPLTTGAGYIGLRDANLFDFRIANQYPGAVQPWQTGVTSMQYRRWYPTATTLGDGRVLVVAGQRYGDPTGGNTATQATIPEVYTPTTNPTPNNGWQQLNGASLALPLYPWMFLAPDGRVFNAGPNYDTRYLDPSAAGAWTSSYNAPGNTYREYGSAVMYAPGKILILGGNTWGNGITNTTALIDITAPGAPVFQSGPDMVYARTHVNATLLPDGTVLATGGTQSAASSEAGAVYAAELWTPPTGAAPTGTWTRLNSMSVPRLYHSTAVLLPDATVLSVGGGQGGGFKDHPDYEIFTPPYLCTGLPRPEISSSPQAIAYGQSFTIATPDADAVKSAGRVTLVRLSSVTHSFNMNQRFVPLTVIGSKYGQLYLNGPSNPNTCPPGHYMLFLIDGNGTPSHASIISINTTACSTLSITQKAIIGYNPNECSRDTQFTVTGGSPTSTYVWTVNGTIFSTASSQSMIKVTTSTAAPTVQVAVKIDNSDCGANSTLTSYFPNCNGSASRHGVDK